MWSVGDDREQAAADSGLSLGFLAELSCILAESIPECSSDAHSTARQGRLVPGGVSDVEDPDDEDEGEEPLREDLRLRLQSLLCRCRLRGALFRSADLAGEWARDDACLLQ